MVCNFTIFELAPLLSFVCHAPLGLYTISKVLDSMGIIKSIPVSVSERQINDTFNDTFHNDINISIKLF